MRATTLHKYILLGGLILGGAGIAAANPSYAFDFTSQALTPGSANSGGSLSMASGTLSVTETAFWLNANNSGTSVTGTGNDFARTWLGAYSGNGLGVCNPNEQTGCGAPQHQIDSYSGLDFINLSFNIGVSLSDIKVASFGNPSTADGSGTKDVDVSYAWLTSAQETALNNGTLVFSSISFKTLTSTDLSANDYISGLSGSGQYLLLGTAVTAQYGGDGHVDAFKLQGVTASQTPEPASFLLIGSGLLGAALVRRHRKA